MKARTARPETRTGVVGQLVRLSATRSWSPPEIGRRMGGKTGQWFRDIAAGRNNMLLRDAEELSRLLGARLTLTASDPWEALDVAIEALPETHARLRRSLRALIAAEREAAAEPEVRQLRVAEDEARTPKTAKARTPSGRKKR